jgi:hypothetical protein
MSAEAKVSNREDIRSGFSEELGEADLESVVGGFVLTPTVINQATPLPTMNTATLVAPTGSSSSSDKDDWSSQV